MKRLVKLTGVFDCALDILFFLGCVLMVFLMLSVTTDVTMRYFLNRPIPWLMEVIEDILVYIPFLGCAWLLRKGGHISIDVVLNRLRQKTQALINMLTSVLGAIVFSPIVWYGTKLTLEYFETGRYERVYITVPTSLVILIIPAGSFLLVIQFLRNAYGNFDRWRASADKEQGYNEAIELNQ